MTRTPTIPITIRPEAAARVAELGFQRELKQMLEHAQQTFPTLRSLEVELELPYDTDYETRITIRAFVDAPEQFPDPSADCWRNWVINAFPPEVWSMLGLMAVYGPAA